MNREQIVSNERSYFYKNLEKKINKFEVTMTEKYLFQFFYYGLKRKISTLFNSWVAFILALSTSGEVCILKVNVLLV
jgi:hypothetical protein